MSEVDKVTQVKNLVIHNVNTAYIDSVIMKIKNVPIDEKTKEHIAVLMDAGMRLFADAVRALSFEVTDTNKEIENGTEETSTCQEESPSEENAVQEEVAA